MPLVYEDSLSYYELLCKVVKKLNEVIESVDGIPDLAAEMLSDENIGEIVSRLFNNLEEQIAGANEKLSETATANRVVGCLVWLNGDLYRATKYIDAGDRYVAGGNVEKITIEEVIKDLQLAFTDNYEDGERVASADREVGELVWFKNELLLIKEHINEGDAYTDVNSEAVDFSSLFLTIENAISNEATARTNADTALGTRIDNEAIARANADTALGERITNEATARANADTALDSKIGNLNELETSIKTSAVDAINELVDIINTVGFWHNVKDEFGAVGDSVTDDTDAIENAISYMQTHRCGLYFPSGDYRITRKLTMNDDNNRWWVMRGAHKTETVIRADLTDDNVLFELISAETFRNAIISDFTIINNNANTNVNAISINRLTHSFIHDVIFRGFVTSLNCEMSWCMYLFNCNFADHSTAGAQSHVILANQCNNWTIENCQFSLPPAFSAYHLDLVGPESEISVRDCCFEYGYGIALSSASASLSVVSISDCYFEWMRGYAVKSNAGTIGLMRNVQIENCYFNAIENDSPAYAIDSRDIDGLSVRDCFSVRFTDSMITTTNTYPTNYEFRNNTTDGVPVTRLRVHEIKGSGTSAPNTGYHHSAEIFWNALPTAGNIGWICSADGTPGTWIPFG